MSPGLVAFLNARLDEEERLANAAIHAGLGIDIGPDGQAVSAYPDAQDHIATWNPGRVLREVEAKRAIIAFALKNAASVDGEWGDGHDAEEIAAGQCEHHGAEAAGEILLPLAAVYSDHPDYRADWKP